MDPGESLASLLLSCIAWVDLLFDLGIGVVALIRLRATPAGMLVGGGFLLQGLTRLVMRGVRRLAMSEDLAATERLEQLQALSLASSCGTWLWLVVIGVGFLLVPASLEKLRAARVPVREG